MYKDGYVNYQGKPEDLIPGLLESDILLQVSPVFVYIRCFSDMYGNSLES